MLSLNVDKTNFILFHPPQKSISHLVKLSIAKKEIKQEKFIKYLGPHIDSHLSWKFHISYISKKIKRCIGILSKIRYFVSQQVLVQLYCTLIYRFLAYSLIMWGNSLLPRFTLQKKVVRIITFSEFNAHSCPLFRNLGFLTLGDLIYLDSALFMYDYYSNRLPNTFNIFFKALIKYTNMQPGWPLRSLIIYRKLGPTMGNVIFVSVELNSGILLKRI